MDVKSLYSKIHNNEGIVAVAEIQNSWSDEPTATKVKTNLFFLILILIGTVMQVM